MVVITVINRYMLASPDETACTLEASKIKLECGPMPNVMVAL